MYHSMILNEKETELNMEHNYVATVMTTNNIKVNIIVLHVDIVDLRKFILHV